MHVLPRTVIKAKLEIPRVELVLADIVPWRKYSIAAVIGKLKAHDWLCRLLRYCQPECAAMSTDLFVRTVSYLIAGATLSFWGALRIDSGNMPLRRGGAADVNRSGVAIVASGTDSSGAG